mgnify:CR=1 FL=1
MQILQNRVAWHHGQGVGGARDRDAEGEALDDGERTGKLDAAVAASGWRELRVAADGDQPLASGVEVAIVAEAVKTTGAEP